MSSIRTLDTLGPLEGKTALVRVDLNLPMEDGRVMDASRIDSFIPTIRHLRKAGARIVLLSHFGRPRGRRRQDMSLAQVVDTVSDKLGLPVKFAGDCVGETAESAIREAGDAIVLLENVRFHAGEENNDPAFAKALADLGDVFISDAFSAVHRAHASTTRIADYLPSAAGLSMERELRALARALTSPARPLAAIVGGAKISSKIGVLTHLMDKVDHLVIGGAMANTFLLARGHDIGASRAEADQTDTARKILNHAREADCTIHLPADVVVARELAAGTNARICGLADVKGDEMILDVGPRTVRGLKELLQEVRTLIWNGPLGAFEVKPFHEATVAVAQEAARLTQEGQLLSVAGGGDTLSALAIAGVKEDFSHLSTGGGAFLEWMEGNNLPGVKAISD